MFVCMQDGKKMIDFMTQFGDSSHNFDSNYDMSNLGEQIDTDLHRSTRPSQPPIRYDFLVSSSSLDVPISY
jgi:hypothetical protein